MSEIGSRIKKKRLEKKLSLMKLALSCGWKNSARVHNYETGVRSPNATDVQVLAFSLQCSPEYLLYGSNSVYSETAARTLMLPVLSWDDLQSMNEENKEALKDNCKQFIPSPCPATPNAFVIKIDNDEFPIYAQDFHTAFTYIVFEPDLKPKNKSFVIIKDLASGQMFFKQVINNGLEFYLKSASSVLPIMRLTPDLEIFATALGYSGTF